MFLYWNYFFLRVTKRLDLLLLLHVANCVYILGQENWKFRQLLCWGPRTRFRPGTTIVYISRPGTGGNGNDSDVHSLGSCNSDQSRLSTRTSSRWDWLCYRPTKTADLGWPGKVS